jgi:hypothetical protein
MAGWELRCLYCATTKRTLRVTMAYSVSEGLWPLRALQGLHYSFFLTTTFHVFFLACDVREAFPSTHSNCSSANLCVRSSLLAEILLT